MVVTESSGSWLQITVIVASVAIAVAAVVSSGVFVFQTCVKGDHRKPPCTLQQQQQQPLISGSCPQDALDLISIAGTQATRVHLSHRIPFQWRNGESVSSFFLKFSELKLTKTELWLAQSEQTCPSLRYFDSAQLKGNGEAYIHILLNSRDHNNVNFLASDI